MGLDRASPYLYLTLIRGEVREEGEKCESKDPLLLGWSREYWTYQPITIHVHLCLMLPLQFDCLPRSKNSALETLCDKISGSRHHDGHCWANPFGRTRMPACQLNRLVILTFALRHKTKCTRAHAGYILHPQPCLQHPSRLVIQMSRGPCCLTPRSLLLEVKLGAKELKK